MKTQINCLFFGKNSRRTTTATMTTCQNFTPTKLADCILNNHRRQHEGGLFCDDMGLRKTLAVIALLGSKNKERKPITAAGAVGDKKKEIQWSDNESCSSESNDLERTFEEKLSVNRRNKIPSSRKPKKQGKQKTAKSKNPKPLISDDSSSDDVVDLSINIDSPISRKWPKRSRDKRKFESSESEDEMVFSKTKRRKVVSAFSSSKSAANTASENTVDGDSEPFMSFFSGATPKVASTKVELKKFVKVPKGMVDGTGTTLIVVPLAVVSSVLRKSRKAERK